MSGEEAAIAGAIIVFAIVVLILFLIPYIIYLVHMQRTLKRCGEHATMNPGLVWLALVPVLGFIWQWVVVFKISSSVKSATNDQHTGGFGVGLAMVICNTASIILSFAAIPGIVLWIIYWIKALEGGRAAEDALNDEDDDGFDDEEDEEKF